MPKILRWLLPLLLLLLGFALAGLLAGSGSRAQPQAPEYQQPVVRVLTVEVAPAGLWVKGHGTSGPVRERVLASEIAGRVTWIAPELETGELVDEGRPLVRLDPRDFQLALESARAQKAQAKLELALEEAEARMAEAEWPDESPPEADSLALRGPQLARARAVLEAAEAAEERARLDLERTEIRAPAPSRVGSREVEVGAFVAIGQRLGRLLPIDTAEVVLPLPADRLALLSLPDPSADGDPDHWPRAWVRKRVAGRLVSWPARVVRRWGEVDRQSQMERLVVYLADPYGLSSGRPALAMGSFVEVVVEGRRLDRAVILPAAAWNAEDSTVVLVGDEGRLHRRTVVVAQATAEAVVIEEGLVGGEKVCLTVPPIWTDETRVEIAPEAAPPADFERPFEDFPGTEPAPKPTPTPAPTPTPTPAPTPTPTPAPSPGLEPARWDCAFVGDLVDVRVEAGALALDIQFLGTRLLDPDHPPETQYFRLPDPDRHIIDLVGLRWRGRPRVLGADELAALGPEVTAPGAVRIAQYLACPRPEARIVLDLPQATEIRLEPTVDGFEIRWSESP